MYQAQFKTTSNGLKHSSANQGPMIRQLSVSLYRWRKWCAERVSISLRLQGYWTAELGLESGHSSEATLFLKINYFNFYNYNIVVVFAIHWHESAMGVPVSPCPKAPPTSLSIPSLWVVPVHWLWVPCFMHPTWTGHLVHIW